MSNLADTLSRVLAANRLSQRQLAKRMGVGPSMISYISKGERLSIDKLGPLVTYASESQKDREALIRAYFLDEIERSGLNAKDLPVPFGSNQLFHEFNSLSSSDLRNFRVLAEEIGSGRWPELAPVVEDLAALAVSARELKIQEPEIPMAAESPVRYRSERAEAERDIERVQREAKSPRPD